MRTGRIVDLGFDGVVLGVEYWGRVDVKVDGSVRTRESSSSSWCSGESFTGNGRSY